MRKTDGKEDGRLTSTRKNKLGAPFGGDGAKPREAQPAIVGVVIGRVGGRSLAAVVGTLRTVRA